MFKTSEQTDQLDEALAKAQSEIENALKKKVNPAFKSKYADLLSHWEACREALANHGISIMQFPVHSDDKLQHLITRIAFKGQFIMAEMSLPARNPDAHGYGGAITYAKRYALAAALGIASEDDDGNAAVGIGKNAPPTKDGYAATGKGPAATTPAIPAKPVPPKPKAADPYAVGKNNGWTRSQVDNYITNVSNGTFTNAEKLAPASIDKLVSTIQAMSFEEAMGPKGS